MSGQWSAKQYVAFEDQRTRPVRDLLAAVPAVAARIAIDIGCGPGNSTELLVKRYPDAVVSGFDSSADMVAAASKRLPLSFAVDDIESWVYGSTGAGYDVILANAVLHWVPDHARLFPALVAKLNRGGVLAVQMPDNLQQPSHVAMREVAAQGPWRQKLASAAAARTDVMAAAQYYELLKTAGCAVDVWRTTYHHPLPGGAADIVEWFKGSGLLPFMAPLDTGERTAFLERYRQLVAAAYPPLVDGSVLLAFPRLFLVAVR